MAVPAHDTRDFEFAKKFNLPIKRVIVKNETEKQEELDKLKMQSDIEYLAMMSNIDMEEGM